MKKNEEVCWFLANGGHFYMPACMFSEIHIYIAHTLSMKSHEKVTSGIKIMQKHYPGMIVYVYMYMCFPLTYIIMTVAADTHQAHLL